MQIQKNVSLAPYTSFNCGGPAEYFALCNNADDIIAVLTDLPDQTVTILGYGTNTLISDRGLPGLTIINQGGSVEVDDTLVIADAGVWWDDLIKTTNQNKLWGLELTNGVPSSVGGAVMGNIAAYGQQVSDTLEWIEVLDRDSLEIKKIQATDIQFEYRASSLQKLDSVIITKAAFRLFKELSTELTYASALKVAEELSLNPKDLSDRQTIILEARSRAGALYSKDSQDQLKTAGSFFKNPYVTAEQVEEIIKHEEHSVSSKHILGQNKVHGGSTQRVSAAHVLLAAGFHRGQTWGNVRLHPDHILKLENMSDASAQEIYDVAAHIVSTVKQKLDIELIPEVQFLGKF